MATTPPSLPGAPRSAAIPSAPGSRRRLVFREDDERDARDFGPRRALLAAAGVWVVAALGAAYGMGSAAWPVGTLAASLPLVGVLLGAGLPTSPERPKAGRAVFILAAMLLLYLADPVSAVAARGDQRRFDSADAVVRARLIRHWVAQGRADLTRLDLSELDLGAVDLSQADLEDSDLSKASLRHADLGGTNLRGAQLAGADLGGAVLTTALVDDAVGFAQARCDAATAMPADWRCENGHPAADAL